MKASVVTAVSQRATKFTSAVTFIGSQLKPKIVNQTAQARPGTFSDLPWFHLDLLITVLSHLEATGHPDLCCLESLGIHFTIKKNSHLGKPSSKLNGKPA